MTKDKSNTTNMLADTDNKEVENKPPVDTGNTLETGKKDDAPQGTPSAENKPDNKAEGDDKKTLSWDERMKLAEEKKLQSKKEPYSTPKKEETSEPSNADVMKELAELRKTNESLASERDTAVKRQSDTQRAFHDKSAELKALKEAQDSAKGDTTEGDPESDQLTLKDLNLSEEALETFEDYDGMKEFAEKILEKVNNTKSEMTKSQREAETSKIDELNSEVEDMKKQVEQEWLDGARQLEPKLDETLENPDFNVWISNNPRTVAEIRKDRDEYDPTWLATAVKTFNDEKTAIQNLVAGKSQQVNQMIAPEQTGIPRDTDNNRKKSWEERMQDAWDKKAQKRKQF